MLLDNDSYMSHDNFYAVFFLNPVLEHVQLVHLDSIQMPIGRERRPHLKDAQVTLVTGMEGEAACGQSEYHPMSGELRHGPR